MDTTLTWDCGCSWGVNSKENKELMGRFGREYVIDYVMDLVTIGCPSCNEEQWERESRWIKKHRRS